MTGMKADGFPEGDGWVLVKHKWPMSTFCPTVDELWSWGTRPERQKLPMVMNGECLLPASWKTSSLSNSAQHFRREPAHNTDKGIPFLKVRSCLLRNAHVWNAGVRWPHYTY